MSSPLQIVMLGMSRYADWQAGTSNRQLEVLDQLRRRSDVGMVLAVDMSPWRRRDVLKYWWTMHRRPAGRAARRFSRLSRRLFVVDEKLAVLSSLHSSPRRLAADVRAAAELLGMSQPVTWSFVPTSAEVLQRVATGLVVFDAVDNWLAHPSYKSKLAELKASYELLAQICHCIFTVNPRNASLFRGRDDVVHVPNGVATERYRQSYNVPEAMSRLRRPIVGYIGTIQDRLDLEIIEELSRRNLGSIVLAGRVWYHQLAAKLRRLTNVYLLGQVPRLAAPAVVSSFDVGVVPHRRDDFLASTEAMKVYEYLAAGKPVVSTTSHEFGRLAEFVLEASTPAAFADAVQSALANDTATRRQQRTAAASECDWSSRVESMVSAVRAKLESA